MEFFTEKNGRFSARSLGEGQAAKPLLRLVMMFIPLGIIAFVFYQTPHGAEGSPDRTPLLIGAVFVVFSSLLGMGLRFAGLGNSVTVDQMNGKVTFRKPGGSRQTVAVENLKRIVINTVPDKASILCLESSSGGSRYIIMYSKDTMKLRQFADELSTLTSLSVSEELKEI